MVCLKRLTLTPCWYKKERIKKIGKDLGEDEDKNEDEEQEGSLPMKGKRE